VFQTLIKHGQILQVTLESYPEPDEFSPHTVSLRSTLTFSSHLCLNLPSGFFPSHFPINIFHAFLILSMHATHLPPFSPFFIWSSNNNHWEAQIINPSLCNFLQPLVISSLLHPHILLTTQFSNTVNLCFSIRMRDQASQPYQQQIKLQFCIFQS
jgi:hypothetical protein